MNWKQRLRVSRARLLRRAGLILVTHRGENRREGSPWFTVYLGPRHVSFPPGRKQIDCTTQVGFSGVRPGGVWAVLLAPIRPR